MLKFNYFHHISMAILVSCALVDKDTEYLMEEGLSKANNFYLYRFVEMYCEHCNHAAKTGR